MNRRKYIFIIVVSILFVVLIMVQHYQPRPVDWNLKFNKNSKGPYASFIPEKMLTRLFPGEKIFTNTNSFYIALKKDKYKNNNLVIITEDFKPDPLDLEALLDFVAEGNQVFISAYDFTKKMKDTLHFQVKNEKLNPLALANENNRLYLQKPGKTREKYDFKRSMMAGSFKSFDSLNAKIIGLDNDMNVNFLEQKFKRGIFYIHLQPMAFTNYHILYGNYKYASHVLSFLPVKKTTWDEYYKPGSRPVESPVKYILSEPALKTSYFLILIGILLYMFFEGKRKQRVIPIVKPLRNESLSFAETVGRLYFKSKDHAGVAKKKIIYFKDFLKTRYNITQLPENVEELKILSMKCGVKETSTEKTIDKIKFIEQQDSIHAETLVDFYQSIEEFKNMCL